MNPIRILLHAAALMAAILSPTGCATAPKNGGGSTTVEFVAPDKFTDFVPSDESGQRVSESDLNELERILTRLGERHVPAGNSLHLKITDVNRAGLIPPASLRRIRVITDAHPASAEFEFKVTGPDGQPVTGGNERLLLAYPRFVRDGSSNSGSLEDLEELFQDWFRKLSRKLASSGA
jgi:hypothetical protein